MSAFRSPCYFGLTSKILRWKGQIHCSYHYCNQITVILLNLILSFETYWMKMIDISWGSAQSYFKAFWTPRGHVEAEVDSEEPCGFVARSRAFISCQRWDVIWKSIASCLWSLLWWDHTSKDGGTPTFVKLSHWVFDLAANSTLHHESFAHLNIAIFCVKDAPASVMDSYSFWFILPDLTADGLQKNSSCCTWLASSKTNLHHIEIISVFHAVVWTSSLFF